MQILWITAVCCALLAPMATASEASVEGDSDPAAKGLANPEFDVTGDARISGNVVVDGALLVRSGADLGLFYVEQTSGEIASLQAVCPSGSRVISGGCRSSDSSAALSVSYPEGVNNWRCSWDSTVGNKSAIVLCAPE